MGSVTSPLAEAPPPHQTSNSETLLTGFFFRDSLIDIIFPENEAGPRDGCVKCAPGTRAEIHQTLGSGQPRSLWGSPLKPP